MTGARTRDEMGGGSQRGDSSGGAVMPGVVMMTELQVRARSSGPRSPSPAASPCPSSPHVARFLCFLFYSAAGVGVQPAAEPRHVQRHEYGSHVYGALRACTTLILHSRALPARCLHHRRFYSPSRLPARMFPSSHASLLFRRARTGCPTQTSSSSVARGRATPRLTVCTVWSGAIWESARPRRRRCRRRHRCRRYRRRRRPTLLMRRHDRRRPTPLRTRPPCGRRSKPTMPTRLPPLRRTAPSPAGASQQSQA